MAGSYSHCTAPSGKFRWTTIENMRDAYEACEMMHWMVSHLAGNDKAIIADTEKAYFDNIRARTTQNTENLELAELARLRAKYPDDRERT